MFWAKTDECVARKTYIYRINILLCLRRRFQCNKLQLGKQFDNQKHEHWQLIIETYFEVALIIPISYFWMGFSDSAHPDVECTK